MFLFSMFISTLFANSINWAQPEINCLENLVPKGIKCLDLTQVKNPLADFPLELTLEEKTKWQKDFKYDLELCRASEVQRREKLTPGTFSSIVKELTWMKVNAFNNIEPKIDLIYKASTVYKLPPAILFGAIKQESLFSTLGITPDGNNFSCGLTQLNILEWCSYMNQLDVATQNKFNWPKISCSGLQTTFIKPFYDLASKEIMNREVYEMEASDYAFITFNHVKDFFPSASVDTQKKRFLAVQSFINNCQSVEVPIMAKAYNLKKLYDHNVPFGLKETELYKEGEHFNKTCKSPYQLKEYPLQTAWLLAVAMYNAGPLQDKILQHYNKMNVSDVESGTGFSGFSPLKLVESLFWGGRFNESRNKIEFSDVYGKKYTQNWMKSCVVQRHVARVIQHVTISGQTLITSLEKEPCSQTIPIERKNSSGQID